MARTTRIIILMSDNTPYGTKTIVRVKSYYVNNIDRLLVVVNVITSLSSYLLIEVFQASNKYVYSKLRGDSLVSAPTGVWHKS